MSGMALPAVSAAMAARAGPQVLPWQLPMPARVRSFTSLEEIIKKNSKSKDKYITELEKINQEITDYSNPVIIKYKLKS